MKADITDFRPPTDTGRLCVGDSTAVQGVITVGDLRFFTNYIQHVLVLMLQAPTSRGSLKSSPRQEPKQDAEEVSLL